MKFFSKITQGLFLPALSFVIPSVALADTTVTTCPSGSFNVLCNFGQGGSLGLVGTAVTLLFVIAIVISLGFLIYGGIRWIMSGGDKSAVETARNTIVAAIVGLVIVFLSYFILNLVLGFFGLPSLNQNLTIPKLSQ